MLRHGKTSWWGIAAMNCPTCSTPIPDTAVVKAAASINGKRTKGKPRPGAKGLVRNPTGKNQRKVVAEREPKCLT